MSAGRFTPTLMGWLDKLVTWIEVAVAALLVVLAAWGALALAVSLAKALSISLALETETYIGLVEGTLTIFVVVELFRIAVAYVRHRDVIPTVMEAGLVALARKLVTFSTHGSVVSVAVNAGALAALLLAVSASWYLLAKRNPSLLDVEHRSHSTWDAPPDDLRDREA